MKNIWVLLFRVTFFLWVLFMSMIPLDVSAQGNVEAKIGGISEKEFKRLYLLNMEMEEKVSIDYWIEKHRLERTLGENPEKLQKALKQLSVELKSRREKFLKDRGTTWEEYHRHELIFTKENVNTLFARYPDVLKRRFEVGKIKDFRMGIQEIPDVPQKSKPIRPMTIEQYLTVSIESNESRILYEREKAQLEKEFGRKSPQVRDRRRKWAEEIGKIFDKWNISPDEFGESIKKYSRDEKAIDAYLAGNPQLKERNEKIKKDKEAMLSPEMKRRREFLETHPDVLKRHRAITEKIFYGSGQKYGKEEEKFLEDNPDLKKEYDAIEQEIQSGIDKEKAQ